MNLSLIIPTYNEKENIVKLINKINKILDKKVNYEIIVVDDNSPDGTYNVVKQNFKENVKAFCRKYDKGLSSAVIFGLEHSSYDTVGVMDADLSHPPEKLIDLINALKNKKADIVVGSRLVKGGEVEEWPWYRKMVSFGARLIARPLVKINDSMSGFFVFKRRIISNAVLRPKGYKILLEILVKSNAKKIIEVPYVFRNRSVGESKLNAKIYIQYLSHLFNLYLYKIGEKFKK